MSDDEEKTTEKPTRAGPALARAALEAARANRAPQGSHRRRTGASKAPDSAARDARRGGYSGAAADPRDPQLLGALVSRLIADRGWERPAAEGTVFGSWEQLVGSDIAEKCQPVSLREGELVVQAESTAWATQLRLLVGKLLTRLRGEIGQGVVTSIKVHGPVGPSWKRGPRSVPGPGPGDTYG